MLRKQDNIKRKDACKEKSKHAILNSAEYISQILSANILYTIFVLESILFRKSKRIDFKIVI